MYLEDSTNIYDKAFCNLVVKVTYLNETSYVKSKQKWNKTIYKNKSIKTGYRTLFHLQALQTLKTSYFPEAASSQRTRWEDFL